MYFSSLTTFFTVPFGSWWRGFHGASRWPCDLLRHVAVILQAEFFVAQIFVLLGAKKCGKRVPRDEKTRESHYQT